MADVVNKENNTKKTGGPQFKMVWELNQGDKGAKKSQSSSNSKTEVGQLKKAVLHLNTKVDKLDQKLDRILELLIGQNPFENTATNNKNSAEQKEQNRPATSNKDHLPKASDFVILGSPKSNCKVPIDCPQFTSTPCHKIAFPATPIQHHLTPIERVGRKNVTNSMESPLSKDTPHVKSSNKKTNALKSAKKEKAGEPMVQETSNTEKPIKQEEKTPFKIPKNKKTPALEIEVNNTGNIEYNPPLIMINSRSRARKQKQSAAMKRISPAKMVAVSQIDAVEQAPQEAPTVNVPTNEPNSMHVETSPVDVTPKCEPRVVTRHDYSITTDSMDSEETAKFMGAVTSTKSNKVAPPLITLDKSKTPVEQAKIDFQTEHFSVASEQHEIPRNSPQLEESTKPNHQPGSLVKNSTSKTNNLQTPINYSVGSIKQEQQSDLAHPSQTDSVRPKRRAAPASLKEKPLNTKMRRNN